MFDPAELDNVTMSLLSKNCLICMMETITQLQSLLSFFSVRNACHCSTSSTYLGCVLGHVCMSHMEDNSAAKSQPERLVFLVAADGM